MNNSSMLVQALQAYYAPALALVVFTVLVANNMLFTKTKKRLFLLTIGLIFFLMGASLGDQSLAVLRQTEMVWRLRCAANALHYGLAPAVPMILTFIYVGDGRKRKKFLFMLPAAVNLLLCGLSIPFGWVFQLGWDGVYQQGLLFLAPYVMGSLYMLLLLDRAMRQKSRPNRQAEGAMIVAGIAMAAVSMLLEAVLNTHFLVWSTTAVFTILYFYLLSVQKIVYDPLTGTFGSVAYAKQLERVDGKACCTFGMVDMNGLKFLNDRYGHSAGDAALRQLTEGVLGAKSYHMKFFRYGGDEFMLFSPRLCRAEMERVLAQAQQRCGTVEGEPVGFAYGVTEYRAEEDLHEALLRVDALMYENKQATHARRRESAPAQPEEREKL